VSVRRRQAKRKNAPLPNPSLSCIARLYREAAEYPYGWRLRVDPRWAMPPGYITEATQRAGIVGQIGRAVSLQARQAARVNADGGHRRARLCRDRLARRSSRN
jgi:hypothetical protein